MNPILVNVLRGGAVESTHSGAFVVVDAQGTVITSAGDIDRPVFPRSAVKLLQALPLVASGAADQLQLTDEELALACASHNGEELHASTALRMLQRAGVDAEALECGTHWPALDVAQRTLAQRGGVPNALHNNCSGKHAGFVCMACALSGTRDDALRAFVAGYIAPDHAVMREVTAALQAATGFDLALAPRGIDGCSIPTFAIPLRRLALAFARIGSGIGLSPDHARAAKRLRRAVAKAPFMVAGSGRFDTKVMELLGERVFCKVGAEGVYCAAFPEQGLGVALKVDDGNNARAAEVAMAALIERFVTLDDDAAAAMAKRSEVTLRNWNGIEVGRLQAAAPLRAPAA